MASWLHLARRFFESLDPRGPNGVDEAWALRHLNNGERALWATMSRVDRRHACGVARRVDTALDAESDRAVLAAALLHDVGKVDSGLGTFGRVVATVWGRLVGRRRASIGRSNRLAGRVARYLRHDEIGGEHLLRAGSDVVTVAWAREHHRPRSEWTIPLHVGDALKAADGD
ncbi:MAG: hypothetical protein AB7L13_21620 [Acidimicrobiia bacterium]